MEDRSLPENSTFVHKLDELSDKVGEPVAKLQTKKNMHKRKSNIIFIVLAGMILSLVIVAVVGYLVVVIPGKKLLSSIRTLEVTGRETADLLKKQDMGAVVTQMEKAKIQLNTVESDFKVFSWADNLPKVGDYYKDGLRGIAAGKEVLSAADISIKAIAPYADIIGLKGIAGSGDGSKTAEDRINFVMNSIEKLQPQLETIGTHLETAKKNVDQIDPNRYPEDFRGYAVRSQVIQAVSLIDQAATLTNDARPLLEATPYILGIKSARKYLVIFQNDAELRPTGGFMTAYAIIELNKGKINMLQSDDIYALDDKFKKKIPAPQPILKYLPKVPYWNLRDQNLSPDLKASMETFYANYLATGSRAVDGVITIDTQVLVDLLKITGTVGVPGYGNFSADIDKTCNCPQAFYALELYADVEGPVVWDSVSGRIIAKPTNYGQRKSFIGPMTYSILSNIMAQPKSKMGTMFKTAIDLIAQKHVQFYFLDPKVQSAAESFNIAGRVRDYSGDYLFIVDTNFAGAKTNTWVTYNGDLKVDIASDGTVTNTLTLTYKNPQPYFVDSKTNLKLNGVFRDWLRVYLPAGSQLIETKGFETGEATGQDLGKTVIEGFFTLTPLNNKTITIKYKSGYKSSSPYRLLLQKQAGTKEFPYKITVNKSAQPEVVLDSDKEIVVSY